MITSATLDAETERGGLAEGRAKESSRTDSRSRLSATSSGAP